ncbi:efflux RND transporter periplasmic adaptor subunit [Desulfofundulus sp. TPOSR]|uniref:efflux RND transporter periplasmic adaptor subunit n=1 Tax=Desulfofundulus sp. TPOSR TaxID=2714340 RepID=UPI001409AB29|nr:efflux RND transporter periplasmic adaptor subunit [Desulfofundulus sp. TPOSR]NHM28695.1 efflux RND transporter periplasmic adaptor subunit [Desulfofundulus sp. TPOSR]
MRSIKLSLAIAGATLLIAVVVASIIRGSSTAAVEVKTARTEERIFEDKVLTTGRIEAFRRAEVVAPFPARLLSLKVKDGDYVAAGQLLGVLDTDEMEKRLRETRAALAVAEAELAQAQTPAALEVAQAEAAFKEAEAQFQDARRKLERYRSLFEQGAVPEADLEAAETEYVKAEANRQSAGARLTALQKSHDEKIRVLQARVEQARVAVDNARQEAAKGRLTAPIGGVVFTTAREGTFLQPGTIILTISDRNSLQVVAEVSEQDVRGIAAGQEAEIHWAGSPGKTLPAKVSRVSPAVTRSNIHETENVVRVYLDMERNDILPGATVDVVIHRVKPGKSLLIPNEALLDEGKTKAVFVVEGNLARKRTVTVGRSNELYTEILAGLKPGAVVVVNPKNIKDGQPVRKIQAGAKASD